jgi:RNA polymerase I-specific transcription initiation factor RRN6
LTQIYSPSVQIPQEKKRDTHLPRSQKKWLLKVLPESFSANDIATAYSRFPSADQPKLSATVGQLLAIGGAIDVEHLPRTEPIIAVPCGEVGQVLQLIRPRNDRHGWDKQSSLRIPYLNATSSERGHWVGSGGTIQQITFAENLDVSSTWLAVRQGYVTTIFRPMYHKSHIPAKVPAEYGLSFSPSCVDTNPVATLTAERAGSSRHADVTFNPYYPRQFAIVDDVGSWSIWDVEGRLRKRTTLDLILQKRGQIYDGFKQHPLLKDPDNADGWHRILWVGSVTTMVVCNRRHLAVFNVKSTPTRLRSTELLVASSTDWILDLKRSPNNHRQLFVLTSSRIYWVEVTEAGEDGDDINAGSRIILSYRHFRDANDESLQLSVLKDDDGMLIFKHYRYRY